MAEKKYNSSSQERGYRVLLLLAGHEFDGLAPGQLAEALKTNPSNITRDLRVLQEVGLAEPLPTDQRRWRLGPKLIQVATQFQQSLTEIKRRADEVQQRYTRTPS
ncbi:helix-turn-helix domain-containing protein [Methylobacillus flagellatus]|uniref:HTH iclR-type domain-containing protein n=1 Tax=Methylobacillus flagellatus (strain ATCC 51484 / DSM 6875 / VKM B-1610 / KT) TaxID=265072 RepID=Q1GXR0_METFK|nr:hypothetical protein [Methylobacillus flagellatus]ABE50977.1 conserved hypothetical protein [Methylobacillus flagellatus KT]